MRFQLGFGDLVRALRSSQNMTQAELSAVAGVSQQLVAKLEAGYRPTDEQIDKLAPALGVPRDALVGAASVELLARNPFQTVEPLAYATA